MLSIYDLVYESLVQIDENYMPQPYLAERWEESSGGKYWTFYLRRDVSFTDGTPLTAADVVASAQYILDKANDENITDHGFYSNLKYFVSGISAKDDYTVTVKTSRPYFGLLYAMTFPVVSQAKLICNCRWCHCEPVRTLAWQSASPNVRRNSLHSVSAVTVSAAKTAYPLLPSSSPNQSTGFDLEKENRGNGYGAVGPKPGCGMECARLDADCHTSDVGHWFAMTRNECGMKRIKS